ncbi:antitoxin Xre/MbcA/ParS toxin-binding domain-containing protein [Ferrimonas sediminicola]|nr:antitoxin Xre/MbcA/ParS toxin-binding domain-containing protein [Ferrimonas sediminicola]
MDNNNYFYKALGLETGGHGVLTFDHIDKLIKITGLPREQAHSALAVSPWHGAEKLLTDEQRALLERFIQAYAATLVLHEGDYDGASHWFTSPVRGLGYNCPIDLLTSDESTQRIITVIRRIEHGVYQ